MQLCDPSSFWSAAAGGMGLCMTVVDVQGVLMCSPSTAPALCAVLQLLCVQSCNSYQRCLRVRQYVSCCLCFFFLGVLVHALTHSLLQSCMPGFFGSINAAGMICWCRQLFQLRAEWSAGWHARPCPPFHRVAVHMHGQVWLCSCTVNLHRLLFRNSSL